MTTASTHTAWQQALDGYEARLTAIRDGLAQGGLTDLDPFQPDPGLGPLPAALESRATALLQRGRELERLVEQARAAIGTQLAATRARTPSTTQPQRRSGRLDLAM